ncbi:hypothetical protein B9G53_05680 [Pseudanabaena sp. SR411]|uniref:hypothetical protein n=1 Tax=Pseudanabaena sp. SR411 TaxID=1980935 RepID=UPI000B97DDEB|nr:hypothetical protein [Pseudanabaena sp. SR411]OYQ66047.1 hypothetical protein B9G53_05680 [Pseudanabaena sp. SR411]
MRIIRFLKSFLQASSIVNPDNLSTQIETVSTAKTWEISQNYEFKYAIAFMNTPDFRTLAKSVHDGEMNISTGYVNNLILNEFFAGEEALWHEFVNQISGKTCLEIGPAVLSVLSTWDVVQESHVVEPLIEQIENWQRSNFGFSVFEGLKTHSHGAEKFIPELSAKIDGAIFCRNCLDHTPKWPFILGNISKYAASGCRLLLWLDLDHHGVADDGHYDITTDPEEFKNLVDALGFDIVREYSCQERFELNWGCFAIKR